MGTDHRVASTEPVEQKQAADHVHDELLRPIQQTDNNLKWVARTVAECSPPPWAPSSSPTPTGWTRNPNGMPARTSHGSWCYDACFREMAVEECGPGLNEP